jgi:hypothetical protein
LAQYDLPESRPAFDVVADVVEQLDGVHFRDLFNNLTHTYPDGDSAIAAIWKKVEGRRKKEEETETGQETEMEQGSRVSP